MTPAIISEAMRTAPGLINYAIKGSKGAISEGASVIEKLSHTAGSLGEAGLIRAQQLMASFAEANDVNAMVEVIRNGSKDGTLLESMNSFVRIAKTQDLDDKFYLMFAPEALEAFDCQKNLVSKSCDMDDVTRLFSNSVKHLCDKGNYTEAEKLINDETLKLISECNNGKVSSSAALCYYVRHLLHDIKDVSDKTDPIRMLVCDLITRKRVPAGNECIYGFEGFVGRYVQDKNLFIGKQESFLSDITCNMMPRPKDYIEPGVRGTGVRPGAPKILSQNEWETQQKNAILAQKNREKENMKEQLRAALNVNSNNAIQPKIDIIPRLGATSNPFPPITSSEDIVQLILEGTKCLSLEDTVTTICSEANKIGNYEIISNMFSLNTLRNLKQNLNEQEFKYLPSVFHDAVKKLYEAGQIERLKQLANPQVTGFIKSIDPKGFYAAAPNRYLIRHVIDGLDKDSPDFKDKLNSLKNFTLFTRCFLDLPDVIYADGSNIIEALQKKGLTYKEAESFYKDCMYAAKLQSAIIGPDGKEVITDTLYDIEIPNLNLLLEANNQPVRNIKVLDKPKS